MDKFSFEANGYNRNEVNQFVHEVIVETERILNKVDEQQAIIKSLKQENNYYKGLINTINKAEETNEDIKRISREESELIISKAKSNASRIINEALLQTEKLENDKYILEKNISILKGKLKVILEQQKVVLDEIDDLDSKD